MRNFMPRHLLRVLVLAAALFCWVQALMLSGDMVKSASSVSFRYETDGIAYSTANRMLNEESIPFSAWVQKNNQHVTEQEFSRGVSLQVLEIAGDPELVLPPEELLYGFLPVRGSKDICAIDVATAYALWGGEDITGEILIYDDREYTVTGVFSRPEKTMLIQSRLEKNTVLPYLELCISNMNTARQQADEIRTRYSLPEPDMLIDHVEEAAVLSQLTLFPAVLAASLLLWRWMRQIFGTPVSAFGRAGFAVSMMAGVLILAWAIGFSPAFPSAVIPSRWSDFSFWSAFTADMAEQARFSRTLTWLAPDMLRLQSLRLLLFHIGRALSGFIGYTLSIRLE